MKNITVQYVMRCLLMILIPFSASGQDSELDWAIHFGGSKFDVVKASCTDELGNLYLTGFFQDTIIINNKTYVAKGNADIFTLKVNQYGNILWLNTAGSNQYRNNLIFEMGTSIAVYKNYVFVCGTFAKSALFEPVSLSSNGGKDIFIAKYHSETGKLIWVKNIGGKGHDMISDMCIDRSGNIVLTGNISSKAKFGDSISDNNSTASFVSKFDDNGNFLWLRYVEGKGYLEGVSVVADKQNNIYWGINFRDGIKSKKETILSKGEVDVYIGKLSAEGDLLWQNQLFGEQTVKMSSLDISIGNEMILTGFFTGKMMFGNKSIEALGQKDIFLCKCNEKGELIWLKSAGGNMDDITKAQFCNSSGEIYLAGEFQESAIFDQDTVYTNENTGLFIAKYSIDGNLIWVQNVASGLHKNLTSIAGDPSANIYLTGGFRKQIKFGDELLSSVGKSDAFVTKIIDYGINKNALLQVESDNSASNGKRLKINPNPTTGKLNIEFLNPINSEVEIEVTDVFGGTTVLNVNKTQNLFSVDLSLYPPGIYLLLIKTPKKIYTEKIVLQ